MTTETRASYNDVGTRVLSVPGSGTPIVLLHGFADSADTWRPVLTRLAATGHRGIAVDLPGFGQADARLPGPMVPQFDAFVDALLAETGPVVLAGNSLGGATAVRAAGRNSSVKALLSAADPLNARHWLARRARAREMPEAFWTRVSRFPIPMRTLRWATRHAAPKVLYGPGSKADPDVVAYWTQLVSRPSDVAALGRDAFRYAFESAGAHRGVRVSCPTVVVHGARDRIIPVHSSRTLHQQIPGSELVILPRSGHCPQLDNPDEVTRLILELCGRAAKPTESAG